MQALRITPTRQRIVPRSQDNSEASRCCRGRYEALTKLRTRRTYGAYRAHWRRGHEDLGSGCMAEGDLIRGTDIASTFARRWFGSYCSAAELPYIQSSCLYSCGPHMMHKVCCVHDGCKPNFCHAQTANQQMCVLMSPLLTAGFRRHRLASQKKPYHQPSSTIAEDSLPS